MRHARRDERGSIFLVAVILTTLLLGMSVALLNGAATTKRSDVTGQQYDRALDVAEGGIDYTVDRMDHWTSGTISTVSLPLSSGTASVTVTPAFAGAAGTYVLKSTGTVGPTTHTISVVVRAQHPGVWQYGLFSNQTLNVSSNDLSDSWTSGPPASGAAVYDKKGAPTVYDAQDTTAYSPSVKYALRNGNEGSNNDVVFADGTGFVFGSVVPGPGDTVNLGGSYVSGTTTPEAAPYVFPPIAVPSVTGTVQTLSVDKKTPQTLGAGTWHYASITTSSNSTLTIQGPATIVVDDLELDSKTNLTLDTSKGPILFYGTGTFLMKSNGSVLGPSTGIPSDLLIYITTDNYTGYTDAGRYPDGNPSVPVGFNSNNTMVGAIYAPYAVVNLPSNYQLFGSCVAQELGPASNFQVHFDQNLQNIGGALLYKSAAWMENPADQ